MRRAKVARLRCRWMDLRGPRQDLQNARGSRRGASCLVVDDVLAKMGEGDGRQGIDNDFAAQSMDNLGAWILGRNMFGPVRGPWKDESWKGWWGDDPPYHTPVVLRTARGAAYDGRRNNVLLCHRRHRVGLKEGERRGQRQDVRIGGGVATIQYLTVISSMRSIWLCPRSSWEKGSTSLSG